MQYRKAERDQDGYTNMFAPPGLDLFQMNDEEQKLQSFFEEDNHFLQYVDNCKSQIRDKPNIKVRTKGNKKIIRIIKTDSSQNSLLGQNQNDQKTILNQINNTQEQQDDVSSQNEQNKIESIEKIAESFKKSNSKMKFHSVHIESTQKNQNNEKNLVDKFLVGVISPTKQRQIRNMDSFIKEQNSLDISNTNGVNNMNLQNTSQMAELLNNQKQILMQQLNKNHSLQINIHEKTPLKKPQNNNIELKKDGDQEDKQIFLNRLLVMRSNQNSSTSQTQKGKPYFNSQKQQMRRQDEEINDKQKAVQNNSFSANHYAGNYQLNQSLQPSNKTMENLISDDGNNFMRYNQTKTEFELKKQQQMKLMEEKYKQTLSYKQQPDLYLQLANENGNSQRNQSNDKKYNQDNVLNILSSSNIGFGIPVLNKNDTITRNIKLKYDQHKQILRNSSPSASGTGMIYYNNLGQLSVSENNNSKKKRMKPNLSISPNNQQIIPNFDPSSKNTFQQQINDCSTSHSQKFAFHQNSVFDSLGQKEKGFMQCVSTQNKDNSNYLNKSFDLAFHLTKRIKQEKEGQNINFERNILNNKNENSILLNNNSVTFTQNSLINQKNSFQSRNIAVPYSSTHLSHNFKNLSATPRNSNYNQQNDQLSPNNNSTNHRVGKGQLYFNEQKSYSQKPLTPTAAVATSYDRNIRKLEADEDYHIKKKKLHMLSLKRSPQKGNSLKSRERQNNTPNNNKSINKLTKSELDRMSAMTGVSPSLLRKSLQNKDQIYNNLIDQSVLSDALISLSNQKYNDPFTFQPLDQVIAQLGKQADQEIQLTKRKQQNKQSKNQAAQKCMTEGNQNRDYDEIYDEEAIQSNGRFHKQAQTNNKKISKLFQETLQKRGQYNSLGSKTITSVLDDCELKTPVKQNIHIENHSILDLQSRSNNKTPIQLLKSSNSSNRNQQKESPIFQNQIQQMEIENISDIKMKELSSKQTNYQSRDRNTRFIHVCIVRNTQEFISFLKDKTNIFTDSQRKQSVNSNSNNPNNNSNSGTTTQQNFKKQINVETLQQSEDPSFYLKTICIPKQKHLIYMTEMSIRYAQDKSFYSNFYQLLQKLNAQENITPHEPFKYIFNNSFNQVTNIFEVQDSVPLLIVSKQKLFFSRSNLIEEMMNHSPSPTSQGKSRLSNANQQNSFSILSPIMPSPHIGYLNKSSILGNKADSFPNTNHLLQSTIKNSIREKMRAQTSLDNHNSSLKKSNQKQGINEQSPKMLGNQTSNNFNQDKTQKSTDITSIVELNQNFENADNKYEKYINAETNKLNQTRSQLQNVSLNKSNQYESKQVINLQKQNLNKQLFDFDILINQSPQQSSNKQKLRNNELKQQNPSYSALMSSTTVLTPTQYKKGILQQSFNQTQQQQSPHSQQMSPPPSLTQQLTITISNKSQQDNVRSQRVNIMRQFLSKFDIPSQKYLQEQLNNDAFWNHSKNEIEELFLDFLCMAQNHNHFLDKAYNDIQEIDNLRIKINKVFTEKLTITFTIMQKQYSQIRKIKHETILKAIIMQTCQDKDYPSNELFVLRNLPIQWNEFLRFHALFVENKWDRDEKIQFIERVLNIDQDQMIIFSTLKQKISEMLCNHPQVCKKLTNYFESNSQANKESQLIIPQARLRELICKEQIITTQEIISALLQFN